MVTDQSVCLPPSPVRPVHRSKNTVLILQLPQDPVHHLPADGTASGIGHPGLPIHDHPVQDKAVQLQKAGGQLSHHAVELCIRAILDLQAKFRRPVQQMPVQEGFLFLQSCQSFRILTCFITQVGHIFHLHGNMILQPVPRIIISLDALCLVNLTDLAPGILHHNVLRAGVNRFIRECGVSLCDPRPQEGFCIICRQIFQRLPRIIFKIFIQTDQGILEFCQRILRPVCRELNVFQLLIKLFVNLRREKSGKKLIQITPVFHQSLKIRFFINAHNICLPVQKKPHPVPAEEYPAIVHSSEYNGWKARFRNLSGGIHVLPPLPAAAWKLHCPDH